MLIAASQAVALQGIALSGGYTVLTIGGTSLFNTLLLRSPDFSSVRRWRAQGPSTGRFRRDIARQTDAHRPISVKAASGPIEPTPIAASFKPVFRPRRR